MSSIDRDVMYVQNPALGAALLWRFVCGHYSNNNRPVQFPVLFIVLPIIFRQDLCGVIKTTQKRSGLSKLSEKLFKSKENDSIHFVNNMAFQMRELTLEAFSIAIETNLLSVITEDATVFPVVTAMPNPSSYLQCKDMLSCADKLGIWCSDLTLLEISKWLKVRF